MGATKVYGRLPGEALQQVPGGQREGGHTEGLPEAGCNCQMMK